MVPPRLKQRKACCELNRPHTLRQEQFLEVFRLECRGANNLGALITPKIIGGLLGRFCFERTTNGFPDDTEVAKVLPISDSLTRSGIGKMEAS